jgi:hypothetical protein
MARRLKNHGDVRRYLASVLNRIESGELDPAIGGRLAYVAGYLLRAIEGDELAERLQRIEGVLDAIRRESKES